MGDETPRTCLFCRRASDLVICPECADALRALHVTVPLDEEILPIAGTAQQRCSLAPGEHWLEDSHVLSSYIPEDVSLGDVPAGAIDRLAQKMGEEIWPNGTFSVMPTSDPRFSEAARRAFEHFCGMTKYTKIVPVVPDGSILHVEPSRPPHRLHLRVLTLAPANMQ